MWWLSFLFRSHFSQSLDRERQQGAQICGDGGSLGEVTVMKPWRLESMLPHVSGKSQDHCAWRSGSKEDSGGYKVGGGRGTEDVGKSRP